MSPITRNLIETSHGGVMPWWMLVLLFLGLPCITIAAGLILAHFAMPRDKK